MALPYWLVLLAEAYGKAGKPEEGLPLLTKALAAAECSENSEYAAEIYRLTGELTLAQSTNKVSRLKSQRLRHVSHRSHRDCSPSEREVIGVARNKVTLPAYGSNKASNTQHATCCPRSTIGSPKALTRKTCKRQRRF